jgi:GDPmannose 4,6-dehydratase
MIMVKKAIITGITGQDGSYLAELLLEKGYEVHGVVRRNSTSSLERIQHLVDDASLFDKRLFLHFGDLADTSACISLVDQVRPSEIYNLAAQSHVRVSFDAPESTGDVTGLGCLRWLEAIRQVDKSIRFYQASTSELFGKVQEVPKKETTPFYPRSPYGVAKLYAHWMTINYRESYDMFACSGILFNHESPRRGEDFVTRKITKAVARIVAGKQKRLVLGNLDAKRDWGHAKDYVYAMWLMLQQETPHDYVIATGETYSIKTFLTEAFSAVGLDWQAYVDFDSQFLRPSEVELLVGDPTKAITELGWQREYDFKALVKEMVEADCIKEGVALALLPSKVVTPV